MLPAVGFSPFVVNTRVSAVSSACPLDVICAPPVLDELLQPLGEPPGGFEQGQVGTEPTPGWQISVPGGKMPRSRRNVSATLLLSPATRLWSSAVNPTNRPSTESAAL